MGCQTVQQRVEEAANSAICFGTSRVDDHVPRSAHSGQAAVRAQRQEGSIQVRDGATAAAAVRQSESSATSEEQRHSSSPDALQENLPITVQQRLLI